MGLVQKRCLTEVSATGDQHGWRGGDDHL